MREDFLKSLKEVDNFTYTENGAGALKSTGNKVLDAFGTLGAMKDSSEEQILNTFYPAFFENRELAIKLLFYIRDIRGGQGMRRVFRVILRSLANSYPEYIVENLDNILFFGRGDDYLCLLDTSIEDDVIKYMKSVIDEDIKSITNGGSCSLLAKWLPSENTSSNITKKFATQIRLGFGMTAREYRKMLSTLRNEINIVESKMSANKWDEIDFDKLPAKASMIYSDAFMRHVQDNYIQYLKDLANGDAKVNAKSLFPVDIVKKCYDARYKSNNIKDRLLLDAMWKALPNYFGDTEETGICMCDTSGSMSGDPLMVSLSLGLYCADKCKGPFKNHFITFDYQPVLQEVIGDNIVDKVNNIRSINPANTDFEAALQLILDAAIKNDLPQEDLPSKLYVISDMQFDAATGEKTQIWSWFGESKTKEFKPFMQKMKEKFTKAGYTMPAIVYWNVRASKCGMFQETVDGENCCMVSGYSPSLFKSVIDGTEFEEVVNVNTGEKEIKQKIDPVNVMLTTLNNERYDRVWVG